MNTLIVRELANGMWFIVSRSSPPAAVRAAAP